jgi:NAD(P)-dependent dehydrogenase (short-subunit alcohol dehydrogenase family)
MPPALCQPVVICAQPPKYPEKLGFFRSDYMCFYAFAVAGVMGVGPGPGGSDQHLAINHYGPFLLTNLLLPRMESGSRIVNVASRAHFWGQLQVKDGCVVPGWSNWWVRHGGGYQVGCCRVGKTGWQ